MNMTFAPSATNSPADQPWILQFMGHLRAWIARNVAPLFFLAFYFLSVVLGNLIYATSLGDWMLKEGGFPPDALDFDTTFTVGYWILLLMPFVVVPIGVWLFRPVLQRFIVGPIVRFVPDFGLVDYVVIFATVAAFVFYALYRTDAFALVGNAINAQEAIDARFTLQSRMTFAEKLATHSLLPFLSFYAIAAAFKSGERLWIALAVVAVAATCTALVAINMKWPILVFYMGAVAGIFIYSRKWPYLKAIIGGIGLVALYLLISTYVFRWVPVESDLEWQQETASGESTKAPRFKKTSRAPTLDYTTLAESSYRSSPLLAVHAVNRMAVSFPYYYKIFTDEGPVCGTLIQTYLPGKKPCAPTFLVYSRIFPNDGYSGRGSAPAAPQITAYAQQGWIGAVFALVFVTAILAAFSAIPASAGYAAAAFTMIGATTGYHYSQLPLEGPIMYDHGILWPLLLVGLYTLCRLLSSSVRNMGLRNGGSR